MTREERFQLITEHSDLFAPWTGPFSKTQLEEWWQRELEFGERWHLLLPTRILHVVSGNTPHAGVQSLLRGLILGCQNYFKLPRTGLPELEALIDGLLSPLQKLILCSTELESEWIEKAETWVVFGNDETIRELQNLAPVGIPFVGHGHRIGIGLVSEVTAEAAELAVQDVIESEQRGCLSLQTVYVEGNWEKFGDLLADSLVQAAMKKPPPRGTLSERGAVRTLRERTRYRIANGSGERLWESESSLSWTVIGSAESELCPSPLLRTVYVRQKPPSWDELGGHLRSVAGVGVFPFSDLEHLVGYRYYPLGKAQQPPFDWYQDGMPSLGSLVRWAQKTS